MRELGLSTPEAFLHRAAQKAAQSFGLLADGRLDGLRATGGQNLYRGIWPPSSPSLPALGHLHRGRSELRHEGHPILGGYENAPPEAAIGGQGPYPRPPGTASRIGVEGEALYPHEYPALPNGAASYVPLVSHPGPPPLGTAVRLPDGTSLTHADVMLTAMHDARRQASPQRSPRSKVTERPSPIVSYGPRGSPRRRRQGKKQAERGLYSSSSLPSLSRRDVRARLPPPHTHTPRHHGVGSLAPIPSTYRVPMQGGLAIVQHTGVEAHTRAWAWARTYGIRPRSDHQGAPRAAHTIHAGVSHTSDLACTRLTPLCHTRAGDALLAAQRHALPTRGQAAAPLPPAQPPVDTWHRHRRLVLQPCRLRLLALATAASSQAPRTPARRPRAQAAGACRRRRGGRPRRRPPWHRGADGGGGGGGARRVERRAHARAGRRDVRQRRHVLCALHGDARPLHTQHAWELVGRAAGPLPAPLPNRLATRSPALPPRRPAWQQCHPAA